MCDFSCILKPLVCLHPLTRPEWSQVPTSRGIWTVYRCLLNGRINMAKRSQCFSGFSQIKTKTKQKQTNRNKNKQKQCSSLDDRRGPNFAPFKSIFLPLGPLKYSPINHRTENEADLEVAHYKLSHSRNKPHSRNHSPKKCTD